VGNSRRKILLGRPRRRWKDNIKMDLREMLGVVRIELMYLRIGTNLRFF
jgi:hypothetical protein